MKSIEVKGKTVDEAILNGLSELGVGVDQVAIEIVQEGTRGFLGFGRSAIVRLSEKVVLGNSAEEFLNGLFERMGIPATADGVESDDHIDVNITGDSTGILIGRRGETLDSLQYLTSLVVNKDKDGYKRIILDTENYRKKREATLEGLARKIAGKVSRTGRRVVLEPMNPYERRILHSTLHDHPDVETVSEGKEPYRRVVVRRKKKGKTPSDATMNITSVQL